MVDRHVIVKDAPVDNLWIRDTGPVLVQTPTSELTGADFNFNYWGENAPTTSNLDRSLAARILRESNVSRILAGVTGEGGGIEVDGEGTFMGTESSWINLNRNPSMTKSVIEEELRLTLGITKFIWFEGIKFFRGDVTDCHIDGLARFAPDDTVLLSRPHKSTPVDDPSHKIYMQAKQVLENSTNAAGRGVKIVEIESPAKGTEEIEQSYVNYLLVNDAIIVPNFGIEETDAPAMETFKDVFADRDVVPILLKYLPREGGGIHCATQQWPSFNGK